MRFMNKRRSLDRLTGSSIVLWLILLGTLISRVGLCGAGDPTGGTNAAAAAALSSQRDWMEIYFKSRKVGYCMRQVDPCGADYCIREEIRLNLSLQGQRVAVRSTTLSVTDRGFVLKEFRFSMQSGAVSFAATGRVEDGWMRIEVGEGSAKRRERIRLANPPTIGPALAQSFKGRALNVGQCFRFSLFDPSTLAQKEMVLTVAGRETLSISGAEYEAFRLETEMWGQPMTFWVDELGDVLKEQGLMGFTLVRCSPAVARRNVETSAGDDVYEAAAVPVSETLERPRELKYLKVGVTGVDEAQLDMDALHGGRQIFQSGMIEVVQERIRAHPDEGLAVKESVDTLGAFLQPEYGIESDHEWVIKTSCEIAGESSNRFAVAKRLLAWVHRNVEKRPVLTVPSAVAVLKKRVGDCNEHSVLLTALLRSAGIPARTCVGLVYARGKFFYHAWTEAHLGMWISMDSTLNQMPTDATHIKMVEGGLQRQVDIIGLIGKLNLEIIDYGYDERLRPDRR